ncbi:hypothetical protein [Klebsiella aerogenes]|uniref:hypothetical protein n=1 Tax=Klebsiella aerogenes TaxID=548 RepID=UPI00128BBA90|nr:hypothetical protein [Klebsiella aerogenes]
MFLLLSTSCFVIYQNTPWMDYYFFVHYILSIVIIVIIPLAVFSIPTFLVKGPLPGVYFKMYRKDLVLDINKDFVPDGEGMSKEVYREFLEGFADDLCSLRITGAAKVIIDSHLLAKHTLKILEKRVEGKVCSVSISNHKTRTWDLVLLNFWYGGKNIKGLRSFEKRENGFKVHKISGRLVIVF